MNTPTFHATHPQASPALIRPRFDIPWPAACAPEPEQLESTMLDWAELHGLLLSDAHRQRAIRSRFAWLAARCYPHAERRLLQTMANYLAWLFMTDDMFVDRVHSASAATVPQLAALLEVMDSNRLGEHRVYGETAWLDICQGLRASLPAEHFQRFANSMRLWACSAGLQILNHLSDRPAGMQTYVTLRRYVSAVYPVIDVGDSANALPLPAAIYYRPEVQQLRLHANNILSWGNDVQSAEIETEQPGHFWNMVALYAFDGSSLQDAIDRTAERIRAEIHQFFQLAGTLEQDAEPSLRSFIAGMKDWLRGYFDWYEQDTRRYSLLYAEQDADDSSLTPLASGMGRQQDKLTAA